MAKSKKKPIVPLIMILVSSLALGASMIYNKTEPSPVKSPAVRPPAVVREAAPITTQTIPNTVNLAALPNPFAPLPTDSGSAPVLSNLPPTVPPIQMPTSGLYPQSIPGQVGSSPGRSITVKAIFFNHSSNHNLAILADGSEELVVNEGAASKWGMIGRITQGSVVINGLAYILDHTPSKNGGDSGTSYSPAHIPDAVPPIMPYTRL